jgi:hypothetical protein
VEWLAVDPEQSDASAPSAAGSLDDPRKAEYPLVEIATHWCALDMS